MVTTENATNANVDDSGSNPGQFRIATESLVSGKPCRLIGIDGQDVVGVVQEIKRGTGSIGVFEHLFVSVVEHDFEIGETRIEITIRDDSQY